MDQAHNRMKKEYGYRKFSDVKEWNQAIFRLYEEKILPEVSKGLAGCIYTQLADVEDECNGLVSEDRKVIKIEQNKMKKINEKLKRRGSK